TNQAALRLGFADLLWASGDNRFVGFAQDTLLTEAGEVNAGNNIALKDRQRLLAHLLDQLTRKNDRITARKWVDFGERNALLKPTCSEPDERLEFLARCARSDLRTKPSRRLPVCRIAGFSQASNLQTLRKLHAAPIGNRRYGRL